MMIYDYKINVYRYISETVSLYTTLYYGDVKKTTCFGCVR